MGFNTTLTSSKSVLTIRDTNPTSTSAFLCDQLNQKSIIVMNGLNQSVTLKVQYSEDGSTWYDIGTTTTVNAGASLVTNDYDNVLTGIKVLGGYIRLVATAGTAPTSGSLTVYTQGIGC